MKRDYLTWAALLAALAVTASAEYQLALAAGFGTVMAAGVPAALDIYAVRAMRAGRDVAAVVLAMIAVNAASHLVTAGLLPMSVPLVVAVSGIAPLVLWRCHALARHTDTAPATEMEPESATALVPHRTTPAWTVPVGARLLPVVARPQVPDHVPDAWLDTPEGATVLPVIARPRPEPERKALPVTRTKAVAKTTSRPRTVTSKVAASEPADDELLTAARRDFTDGTPGVKALKEKYGIGQARAQRIRDELRDETTIRVARDYQEGATA